MKKHSHAIRNLRNSIKAFAEEGRSTRSQIGALKQQPETGPKRHGLKVDYDYFVRRKARAALLAYGLLRDIPYEAMEPKCTEAPSGSMVYKAIQEAFDKDEEQKAEWSLIRVQDLLSPASVSQEEAA